MKLIIFPIVLLLVISGFSQTKADTIRNGIATAAGTKRVDYLLEANNVVFDWSADGHNIDSTYFYSKLAYDEAAKIGYIKGQFLATGKLYRWATSWIDKRTGHKDCEMAVKYATKGVALAKQLKCDQCLADAYYTYGGAMGCGEGNANFEKAIESFKKAASFAKSAGNTQMEGQVYWTICSFLSGKGNYEDGFNYCQNALTITKAAADKETKGTGDYIWSQQLYELSLLNIANLYAAAADVETASQYLQQAIAHQKEKNPCCPFDDVVAEIYSKTGHADSALAMLARTAPRHTNSFYFKNSKAKALIGNGRFQEAIPLLLEAKADVQKSNKFHSYAKLLVDLGRSYLAVGDYTSALKYAKEGATEAEKNNVRPYMLEAYQTLSFIYKKLNNEKLALEFFERYSSLKETMLNTQFYWRLNNYKKAAIDAKRSANLALLKKDNLIKAQQLQQQTLLRQQNEIQLSLLNKDSKIKDQLLLLSDQKLLLQDQRLKEQQLLRQQKESALGLMDKETRLKDQQLKQQSFVRNALLGGLFLIIALAAFALLFLNSRRRNDGLRNAKIQAELQQQTVQLEMQALRAQMNPHFIFNCLSSINRFILKHETKEASKYLTRFSRLMRMVLTSSKKSFITLEDELQMLRLYIEMERLRFNNSFSYQISLLNEIDTDNVFIPPLLLQPFCENAIWHGLMQKDGEGKLDISLEQDEDTLKCTITDNGIGRQHAEDLKTKTAEKQKSLGIKITSERLSLLNESTDMKSFFRIEDITDENGDAAGTRIILQVKCNAAVTEPLT
jgi:hypothetical protein